MKKYKIILLTSVFVLLMGISVFGQSIYKTPLDAAAGMTGRTKESIVQESMEKSLTLTDIMYEAGLLVEYENELINQSKVTINERVVSNQLTKNDANNIVYSMDNKQDNYWNHIGFEGGCYVGGNCHDGSMHGHTSYTTYNNNTYKHHGYCGSDGIYYSSNNTTGNYNSKSTTTHHGNTSTRGNRGGCH